MCPCYSTTPLTRPPPPIRAQVMYLQGQAEHTPPPHRFKETMVNVIGFREAEKALQLGTLYTGAQALRVGLVDELVPAHSLKEACAKQAKIWASIPGMYSSGGGGGGIVVRVCNVLAKTVKIYLFHFNLLYKLDKIMLLMVYFFNILVNKIIVY